MESVCKDNSILPGGGGSWFDKRVLWVHQNIRLKQVKLVLKSTPVYFCVNQVTKYIQEVFSHLVLEQVMWLFCPHQLERLPEQPL